MTCGRLYSRAAGTRIPWHPVPSRAALAKLAVSAIIGTCPDCPRAFSACLSCRRPTEQVRRMSYVYYKVTTLGLDRWFFIIGWEKDAVCLAFTHVFLITADREIGPFSFWCQPISPNRLGRTLLYKAFVRLRLLMIWYSITLSAKQSTQPRSAQILRKILAKPHVVEF